mmetsp:Transcript_623/g.980  ORF Transcript_623/g.980 Transcript_623/m.980 type:complete len:192 (-) Transcript_623:183-758(-)
MGTSIKQRLSLAKERLSRSARNLDKSPSKSRKGGFGRGLSFLKKKPSGSVSTVHDSVGSETISLPSTEEKSVDETDNITLPPAPTVVEETKEVAQEEAAAAAEEEAAEEEAVVVVESKTSTISSLTNIAFQILIAITVLAALTYVAAIATDQVDTLTEQCQNTISLLKDQGSALKTQLQQKANELSSMLDL